MIHGLKKIINKIAWYCWIENPISCYYIFVWDFLLLRLIQMIKDLELIVYLNWVVIGADVEIDGA